MQQAEKTINYPERRKFPRLSISVEVDYSIIDNKSLKEDSKTKDISAGGICLIAYEDVPIHSILSLTISLPDSPEPIKTKGRVVWKREFDIDSDQRIRHDLGVEFIEIQEQDRERISRYVFKLLPG